MLIKVRNHGISPNSSFLDFLKQQLCYCHSLHISYFQLSCPARPQCGKGIRGTGTTSLRGDHTVCFSLPFSLDSPVPCSYGPMGSSRAGRGKGNRSGSGPQDFDGNHEWGECSSLPTGGCFHEIPIQKPH